MGPVEAIIVIAIIVGIVLLIRSMRRRGGPDRPDDRGPYSSRAETTGSMAAFGASMPHDEAGSPDGGGNGGGGGD